ncbi:UNVERIFIED_CONTAM: Importin subunit alpha-1a [Sesamum radiatum]|uniref:Importin subunit alpha-1a n=1 Tax=Sesamum radiatum TaxID=300843 RepID=A0AAW2S8Y6_SESRA
MLPVILLKCRDLVLAHGALVPLLAQLNENAKLSMLRNATWTLSNFCRGKPQPHFEQVRPALPALQRLIYSNDEEVLTDACWALSYLSDGTNDKIQAVIVGSHPSPSVLIPALRTVGNIVTGDDLQTQRTNRGTNMKLCNCSSQSHLVMPASYGFRLDALPQRFKAVIDSGLIGPLVNLLLTAEFDIKKEAAWAIQMQLPEEPTSKSCNLFGLDVGIVTVCLEGLENILKVGVAEKGNTGDVNYFAQLIDEAGGLEKIENLQSHDNNEIYEKAVKILETYWLEEEDETLPEGDGVSQDLTSEATAFNFHLVDSVLAESSVDEAVSLVTGDTNDLVEVGMVGVGRVGLQHVNGLVNWVQSQEGIVGSFYAVVVNKQSKELHWRRWPVSRVLF